MLKAGEILEIFSEDGAKKASLAICQLLTLGMLAGIFIGLAGLGSSVAASGFIAGASNTGLGRLVMGAIFPVGLIMVVMGGAQLFTGNNLMLISAIDGKISWMLMLRNWIIVYLGNLIGSILIALLAYSSGVLELAPDGLIGALAVKMAAGKVSLTFGKAVLLGIGCNILVCMAVFMAAGARDTAGKVLVLFFPIMLFVICGFEHSVANMYYIPLGIFAKDIYGTADMANALTWQAFLVGNLIPVSIGNVIGGSLVVGGGLMLGHKG